MNRSIRAVAALFLLLRPGLPGAQCTTFARMDLREMAARAAYVARVRCVATTNWADASLVWTLTTFEVAEAWKGDPPARFTVRLPGGEAAGLRATVEGAPRFTVGEEDVLFLEPGRERQMNIVSWAQGTFRVHRNAHTGVEEAIQDTAGVQVLDPGSGKSWEGARRATSLAHLRATVARALAEAAR